MDFTDKLSSAIINSDKESIHSKVDAPKWY